MDGAAGGVAFELRHLQYFGNHALADERGVAVDEKRQDALTFFVADAILLGADQTFDDGIDGFEMAGVERDRDKDFFAERGAMNAAGAEVILDVAGALHAIGIGLAFELGEDLRHVDLPTMLASTFKRPRCAMPMTASCTFSLAPRSSSSSSSDDGAFETFESEALLADEAWSGGSARTLRLAQDD